MGGVSSTVETNEECRDLQGQTYQIAAGMENCRKHLKSNNLGGTWIRSTRASPNHTWTPEITTTWTFEYECNDPNGVSLGANITTAGQCNAIAMSKGAATYVVKFGGDVIETHKFEAPKAPVDVPAAPAVAATELVAAPPSTIRYRNVDTSAVKSDVIKRISAEIYAILEELHATTRAEYQSIGGDETKMNAWIKDIDDRYKLSAEGGPTYRKVIKDKIQELANHIEALAKATKKESFSQPDLGTYQGYDIFMLLLVFILIIVIAIYFKAPQKVASMVSAKGRA